jgi:Ca2+-binding EF-hand superfamily protein
MKERFSTTAGCFRAFDRSQTGEINLPEFQHALETLLKVKIMTQDSEKVFKWLDSRSCGVIDFKDFSRINRGIINEAA